MNSGAKFHIRSAIGIGSYIFVLQRLSPSLLSPSPSVLEWKWRIQWPPYTGRWLCLLEYYKHKHKKGHSHTHMQIYSGYIDGQSFDFITITTLP